MTRHHHHHNLYFSSQLNSSLAPINIASAVLDCHREGELHYPGYYRPCEKYQMERRSGR